MNTENKTRYNERRILTSTERQDFNRIAADEKAAKTETEQFFPGPGMGTGDSEQVQRIKKTLAESEPDALNRWERQRKEKRAKELEASLKKRMVPRSHIGLRASKDGVQSFEFRKASSFMANGEMSSGFQGDAQEYKNIMRELGREEEANLENIRPDTL